MALAYLKTDPELDLVPGPENPLPSSNSQASIIPGDKVAPFDYFARDRFIPNYVLDAYFTTYDGSQAIIEERTQDAFSLNDTIRNAIRGTVNTIAETIVCSLGARGIWMPKGLENININSVISSFRRPDLSGEPTVVRAYPNAAILSKVFAIAKNWRIKGDLKVFGTDADIRSNRGETVYSRQTPGTALRRLKSLWSIKGPYDSDAAIRAGVLGNNEGYIRITSANSSNYDNGPFLNGKVNIAEPFAITEADKQGPLGRYYIVFVSDEIKGGDHNPIKSLHGDDRDESGYTVQIVNEQTAQRILDGRKDLVFDTRHPSKCDASFMRLSRASALFPSRVQLDYNQEILDGVLERLKAEAQSNPDIHRELYEVDRYSGKKTVKLNSGLIIGEYLKEVEIAPENNEFVLDAKVLMGYENDSRIHEKNFELTIERGLDQKLAEIDASIEVEPIVESIIDPREKIILTLLKPQYANRLQDFIGGLKESRKRNVSMKYVAPLLATRIEEISFEVFNDFKKMGYEVDSDRVETLATEVFIERCEELGNYHRNIKELRDQLKGLEGKEALNLQNLIDDLEAVNPLADNKRFDHLFGEKFYRIGTGRLGVDYSKIKAKVAEMVDEDYRLTIESDKLEETLENGGDNLRLIELPDNLDWIYAKRPPIPAPRNRVREFVATTAISLLAIIGSSIAAISHLRHLK
jgi:hypothetical protein